ncbi:hypothetical protein R3P38DRAFT_1297608 [Favolaschia claudopus]|uniref:Uncharacterized protein n=1 Tax=Favolaschia claudopus TaxID=2862362 RepID=A0AAW0AYY8_9AGAR
MSSLPPTTHSLPAPQRLRLMRSTRKLTALLGTTPLLVDAEEPPRTVESPLEPINSHDFRASIASVLSFADGEPPASYNPAALVPITSPDFPQRPTFLLRINTAPIRSGRRRSESQSSWRGRPTSEPLPSPTSVTFGDDGGVDGLLSARRKKMARVARTLGENIPPELVFPPNQCSPRISADSDTGSEATDEEVKSRFSAEEIRFARIALEPLEESIPLHTAPIGPAPSKVISPRQSASDRAWLPQGIRRSMSQRRRSGSHSTPVVMRKETGWTGEWNHNENTVVKTLRELK